MSNIDDKNMAIISMIVIVIVLFGIWATVPSPFINQNATIKEMTVNVNTELASTNITITNYQTYMNLTYIPFSDWLENVSVFNATLGHEILPMIPVMVKDIWANTSFNNTALDLLSLNMSSDSLQHVSIQNTTFTYFKISVIFLLTEFSNVLGEVNTLLQVHNLTDSQNATLNIDQVNIENSMNILGYMSGALESPYLKW